MLGVPEGIQATCDVAAITKASCAKRGYSQSYCNRDIRTMYACRSDLSEAMWDHFSHQATPMKNNMESIYNHTVQRSIDLPSPLINRGTFARKHAIRSVVEEFLKSFMFAQSPDTCELPCTIANENTKGQRSKCCCQIISLGAGLDALPFELHKDGMLDNDGSIIKSSNLNANCSTKYCKYVEIDVEDVVTRKIRIMDTKKEVLQVHLMTDDHYNIKNGSNGRKKVRHRRILSQKYNLISANIMDTSVLRARFDDCGIDYTTPTLVLLECVLAYWKSEDSSKLLKFLAKLFHASAVLVYEQVRPEDAYGMQMVKNLKERGCPLLGISQTAEHLAETLKTSGWNHSGGMDMLKVWTNDRLISVHDRKRVSVIEPLDKLEEWNLIQSHYALVLASVNSLKFLLESLGFHP